MLDKHTGVKPNLAYIIVCVGNGITGLGLWSVYMKVKALGGICNVKDNEPHGNAMTWGMRDVLNQKLKLCVCQGWQWSSAFL